ncbi:MAG TPA: hypothetical protein VGF32_19230 [Streptosporangiaceae bacterium]
MITTNKEFENFIENDDDWFSDIETKVLDLEQEISDWRESRTRDVGYGSGSARRQEREREREPPETGYPPPREMLRARGKTQRGRDYGRTPTGRTPAGRTPAGRGSDRAQALIEHGRRTARRPRSRRGYKIGIVVAAGLAVLLVAAAIMLRKGPSWPPSVATVRSEITTACQNPNVASEPGQVNFACGQDTSQILWVFALLTSSNNPGYADAKTGRKGLEPITPAQGGQIAWSLNLHHAYDPFSPTDSLEVAARAINNIIGGATLTGASGKPVVQPGLESKPENCARYTGSPAIVSRAGFPSRCASPVTSQEGQAALVADVYQRWMPGATPVAAQNASVLFANAGNPGNPQVQAILKTLPSSGG